MIRNTVLDGFRDRKLDDIQWYTFNIVFTRSVLLYEKSAAEKEKVKYHQQNTTAGQVYQPIISLMRAMTV